MTGRLKPPTVSRVAALIALAASAIAGGAPAAAPVPAAAPPATADGDARMAAALADLGFAMLRAGDGNAVVSPLAVAGVLGMVHAGANGAAEQEIEALFGGGRAGARALRHDLPALWLHMNGKSRPGDAGGDALRVAARLWVDGEIARDLPAAYRKRIGKRYAADGARLSFADPDAARKAINGWTSEKTGGRVTELLPSGSVSKSTRIALTGAVHFKSAWDRPFEAEATEPRPFAAASGKPLSVPTMSDERPVAQAVIDGAQVLAVPFAADHDLVIAMPAAGRPLDELVRATGGATLARWRGALAPARCALALPKFSFAPRAGSIKDTLESLGVKTVFTARADLRPMLGRAAAQAHVDDVHQAAGITIDERGGEAVAAAAATVKPKSLAAPAPACAVDRAFVFALVHRASGAPVFVGRVTDPTRAE